MEFFQRINVTKKIKIKDNENLKIATPQSHQVTSWR
jgi:hypothetical protein